MKLVELKTKPGEVSDQSCPKCDRRLVAFTTGWYLTNPPIDHGDFRCQCGYVGGEWKHRQPSLIEQIKKKQDEPFCADVGRLTAKNERLQKDRDDLNRLLRDIGWGQGEIDSSATIAEENERLRLALCDAIRRPLGVVPQTAYGLITDQEIDLAERRRPLTSPEAQQ